MKCQGCQNEMTAYGDGAYYCENCETRLIVWNGIEEWSEPGKEPYFVTSGPEYDKRKASVSMPNEM